MCDIMVTACRTVITPGVELRIDTHADRNAAIVRITPKTAEIQSGAERPFDLTIGVLSDGRISIIEDISHTGEMLSAELKSTPATESAVHEFLSSRFTYPAETETACTKLLRAIGSELDNP